MDDEEQSDALTRSNRVPREHLKTRREHGFGFNDTGYADVISRFHHLTIWGPDAQASMQQRASLRRSTRQSPFPLLNVLYTSQLSLNSIIGLER
jgi:hypothetical protein